ncbi:MAG: molybdate ABC transporter substrate-binding protein [Pseudomonadota bacterium]
MNIAAASSGTATVTATGTATGSETGTATGARHLARRPLLALLAGALLPAGPALAAERPLVFAAASLSEVLQAAAAAWAEEGHAPPRFSFAATSALARQIEAGAPADLFVSADSAWMDHVAAAGLLRPDSRTVLAGNALVVVGPALMAPGPGPAITVLSRLPADARLAVALTDAVPAGRYARAALTHLDLWQDLRHRLAETDNVRSALALVARGEAPLGIVYATDAVAEPRVQVLARLPRDSHPPIAYTAALTAAAGEPARRFLAYLASPEGRAIFAASGFADPPSIPGAVRPAG